MSNVKRVNIEFEIDFDFGGMDIDMARDAAERVAGRRRLDELKSTLFSMCFAPGVGLRLEWSGAKARQSSMGGQAARYIGRITGQEAFSWGAFDALQKMLERVPHTDIRTWQVVDIEA